MKREKRRQAGLESLEPRRVLDSTVVFNEIMYHPAEDSALEFVELYNQMGVDMDVSQWSLDDGVQYKIPEGTIVPSGGYLVIARDPDALRAANSVDALGPFSGQLSNNGEAIELRDRNDRLMDVVEYNDAGDWPLEADGAGASLAKPNPNAISGPAENWSSSILTGGTPGQSNFGEAAEPGEEVIQTLIPLQADWRYDDAGNDLGNSSRAPSFDDSNWSGAGDSAIYFAGSAQLEGSQPEPFTGVSATASSELSGHTASQTVDGSGLNDGAHVTGPSIDTMWQTNGTFFGLPPDTDPEITFDLGQEQAVDAIQVWNFNSVDVAGCCTDRGIAVADILVAGEDGNFVQLIGDQTFDRAPGTNSDFAQTIDLGGEIARYVKFDVDTTNGVANHGAAFDFVGLSEVQFVVRPDAGDTRLAIGPTTYYFRTEFDFNEAVPRTQLLLQTLIDDGAAIYLNGDEVYRENLPAGPVGSSTLAAPAVQDASLSAPLAIPAGSLVNGRNVLAVEVHQSALDDNDMVFALELTSITSPPAPFELNPVPLAINEVSAAEGSFFVELYNYGSEELDLSGMQLESTDGTSYAIADGTRLAAGTFLSIGSDQFDTGSGERIALYSADRTLVLDAAKVSLRGQGRETDGQGRLIFTSQDTPGGSNQFDLNDQIVINEIMYNYRPDSADPGTPPTFENTTLTAFDGDWRYNESGEALPTDWYQSDHPVAGDWKQGGGLLGFETGTVASPGIGTELSGGPITYYFETDFTLSQDQIDSFDLFQLRHITDDGAVFYINGSEVLRYNLPDGPLSATERTSSSVNNAAVSDPTPIASDVFHAGMNRLSVEVHQRSATSTDMLMGTQLSGGKIVDVGLPAKPFSVSDEEWIELFNRSSDPVDLSGWQLSNTIDFKFPSGTSLAAGDYLVVAHDADALRAKYPNIAPLILGNYRGQLNNQTDRLLLLDSAGNPADEVRYFENGQWPAAADGRGSSLELQDPHSDNSTGGAWAASDESDDSQWQTYTYEDVASRSAVGPDGRWEEIVLGLLRDGEILLDDIQVIENPNGQATDLIQNGSFESDALNGPADHWRIIGNHSGEVITDPDDPSNQVLRFVATGSSEHMHNHAETTLKEDIRNGTEYRISYRAKWITGANLLNSRLYFNRLARTTLIQQPDQHGTPGEINSTFVSNFGPTYENLRHSPVVPDPGQPVTVTVEASDPQQIGELTLWYSVESGPWISLNMSPAGEDRYLGQIPGASASSVVQFYVEGQDAAGGTSVFPRDGRDSRALYQVQDGEASDDGLHNLRMITTPDDAALLHQNIELMSNGRRGATIIYNESEVFYDAGIRLSGSQRARPFQPRLSFSLGFNSDQLFRGVHSAITIDRSESTGFGQREHLYHHGMNHSGGLPSEYNDLFYIITPRREHTGTAEAQLARYSDIFLDEQFSNGSDGQLYEYELIYFPTTTVDRNPESRKLPQPDEVAGTPFRHLSDNKDDYRWNYLNKNNRLEDDYSQLIEFTRIMGTGGNSFESQIDDVIDVDQWLRAFGFAVITGHGDNYGSDGSQHNLQLYVRPEDNRVLQFPHDLDAFFSVNRALVGNGDLRKLIRVPEWEHMYYGHVFDMIQTTFNEAYMQHWTDYWGSLLPRQNFGNHLRDVVRRSDFLITQIERAASRVDFTIATDTPSVDESAALVTGTGWVDVRELRLAGSDAPLSAEWTDVTDWQATVPLAQGVNDVMVEAYDFQGALIGSATVQIASSVPNSVSDSLRIAEIHYNPADPSNAELAAIANLDSDDFEFIEFINVGDAPINLLGAQISNGVDYVFPSATLGAGEYAVVVQNPQAFRLRYGNDARVIGQFADGRLADGGERLAVSDATGSEFISFSYGDNDPWPVRADGAGASLVLADATNTPLDQLNKPYRWQASSRLGGTPGAAANTSFGVVINEVLTNTEPPAVDAIELLNVSSQEVDLSDWWLSDAASSLQKFAIPEGTRLAPGEYVVFDESDFNPNPANPAANHFALSGAGDDVWLTVANADGQIEWFADDVHFVAARSGESFGRFPEGTGRLAPMETTTLGSENSQPRVGPVVISEVQYNPGPPSAEALAIEGDIVSSDLEFIEISNTTSQTLDLTGWRMRGGIDYDFPDGMMLAAGEAVVLLSFNPADPDNGDRLLAFQAHYNITANIRLAGGYSGQLDNDYEKVQLRRPDRSGPSTEHTLEDEVVYDDVAPWPTLADGSGQSLTRIADSAYGNLASSWRGSTPSPGAPAIDGDLNQDGVINIDDVDLLCQSIREQDLAFDLNGDGQMNRDDMALLIEGVLGTTFGDSNLDGIFNSSDLVEIFIAGEYQDDTDGNSTWAEGDWNCDGDFTSSDFVVAFEAGKYSQAANPNREGGA